MCLKVWHYPLQIREKCLRSQPQGTISIWNSEIWIAKKEIHFWANVCLPCHVETEPFWVDIILSSDLDTTSIGQWGCLTQIKCYWSIAMMRVILPELISLHCVDQHVTELNNLLSEQRPRYGQNWPREDVNSNPYYHWLKLILFRYRVHIKGLGGA